MSTDDASSAELNVETLRSELDLRWPAAVGDARATTDETHRLVLCHPAFDGFVSLDVRLRCDIDDIAIEPDAQLDRLVTAHHRTGAMYRGQVVPIDIELHPGNAGKHGSSGLLRVVDGSGEAIAPSIRITIATDPSLDCVLAGAVDGPFADPDDFQLAVDQLLRGRERARRLAARIESLAAGKSDPGARRRFRWGRTCRRSTSAMRRPPASAAASCSACTCPSCS